ncbi:MAG: hypothetical protein AAFR26_26455 [Cyanobacteria bacterium J06626_4]
MILALIKGIPWEPQGLVPLIDPDRESPAAQPTVVAWHHFYWG